MNDVSMQTTSCYENEDLETVDLNYLKETENTIILGENVAEQTPDDLQRILINIKNYKCNSISWFTTYIRNVTASFHCLYVALNTSSKTGKQVYGFKFGHHR